MKTMEMSVSELGAYLETMRKGLKFSRARVAEILGTSRSQIERIEKGEQEVGAMQLARLSVILHVSGNRAFELLMSETHDTDQARRLAHGDLSELLAHNSLEELRKGVEH